MEDKEDGGNRLVKQEMSQDTLKRISGFYVLKLNSKKHRWEKVKKIRIKKLITRSSIFFAGAVVGLIVGALISVVFVICETAYIDHRARVDQYQIDREIFYGDKLD